MMFAPISAHRLSRVLGVLFLALALLTLAAPSQAAPTGPARQGTGTYTNPLQIQIPGDGQVESCADPTIIHAQQPGDTYWYIYCTTDPLNDQDRNPSGGFNFHLIPELRSYDLVHWTYMGDAFSTRPSWVRSDAGLWAPEVQYFNGQYYFYFTASDISLTGVG